MRTIRVITGLVFWLASFLIAWWWVGGRLSATDEGAGATQSRDSASDRVTDQLWRYLVKPRSTVELEMKRPVVLAVGDPIFWFDDEGTPRQVGEVARVADAAGRADQRWTRAASAQARLYSHAPTLAPSMQLEYYATPDSLDWVLATMLPPQKREQIASELSIAFQEHQEEIVRSLRPVVEEGFREGLSVVEQDLPKAVQRHRAELQQLGQRYQGEIVEKRLAPLVQKEIWPLVQRRAEPLAKEIGQEVWQRASLWRFGWRFAYDASPLPEQNLVEKEWTRFLRTDAGPILKSHTDDFIRLQQQVLADVARNERVRQVVRESLLDVADDPQVQRVAWNIVQEAILENPRLRETLERRWQSEEARRAMTIAAERLEPTVRRLGDLIFGTRRTGITPEFARVLRSQILQKDRRWLVLIERPTSPETSSPSGESQSILQVKLGRDDALNPFVAHQPTIEPHLRDNK